MRKEILVICRDSGPEYFDPTTPPVDGAVRHVLNGRTKNKRDAQPTDFVVWIVDSSNPVVPPEVRELSTEDLVRDIETEHWSLVFMSGYEHKVGTLVLHDAPSRRLLSLPWSRKRLP